MNRAAQSQPHISGSSLSTLLSTQGDSRSGSSSSAGLENHLGPQALLFLERIIWKFTITLQTTCSTLSSKHKFQGEAASKCARATALSTAWPSRR